MDEVDVCIIGAGVVGLAIAARLADESRSLFIVDEQPAFGQEVSSRNSEVIHAGIYYPKDSLKARLCVTGKRLMYEYCDKWGISHKPTGKVIVATRQEDENVLESIVGKAADNGVDDLVYWSHDKLSREEPCVKGRKALFSPSSGILSAHELMLSLLHQAESKGGNFAPLTQVTAIDFEKNRFVVHTLIEGKQAYSFRCRLLVNSAGLGAQRTASGMSGLDQSTVPTLYLCKGNYFALSGQSPFSHLIYPVPDTSGAGLGIHATLDLGGQARFGPDVEYIEEIDYQVSEERASLYYQAVRQYYPGLEDGQLAPAYAGIRPKLQAPDGQPEDFVIQGAEIHGIPGLVQLYGIESPGLTASLAIADEVSGLLEP